MILATSSSEGPRHTHARRKARRRWRSATIAMALACSSSPILAEPSCVPEQAASDAVPRLQWPIDGALARPFGVVRNPLTGRGAIHTGIDIEGTPAASVRAALSGRVSIDKTGYGFGPELLILSGASAVRYRHIVISVRDGACIEAGQTVGRLGHSRDDRRLHLELSVHSRTVDPRPYLPP